MYSSDNRLLALVTHATLTLSVLLPGAALAEQHISCPDRIMANQVTVASPKGWKGLVRPGSWMRLIGAAVWTGPLDGDAPGELTGETIKRKDGAIVHRFSDLESEALEVPIAPNGAAKEQIERVRLDNWMVCQYGDGSVVQAMKLPGSTKECEVVYRPLKPKKNQIAVLSDIVCR